MEEKIQVFLSLKLQNLVIENKTHRQFNKTYNDNSINKTGFVVLRIINLLIKNR